MGPNTPQGKGESPKELGFFGKLNREFSARALASMITIAPVPAVDAYVNTVNAQVMPMPFPAPPLPIPSNPQEFGNMTLDGFKALNHSLQDYNHYRKEAFGRGVIPAIPGVIPELPIPVDPRFQSGYNPSIVAGPDGIILPHYDNGLNIDGNLQWLPENVQATITGPGIKKEEIRGDSLIITGVFALYRCKRPNGGIRDIWSPGGLQDLDPENRKHCKQIYTGLGEIRVNRLINNAQEYFGRYFDEINQWFGK